MDAIPRKFRYTYVTGDIREPWIDNARMFAMACVVIAHIKSAMGTPCTQGFSYWIVSFNMPLFVIISSYLAQGVLSKLTNFESLIITIEKYALRIALPTLFATSFFIVSLGGIKNNIYIYILAGLIVYWFLLNKGVYNNIIKHTSLLLVPLMLMYCGGYWFMEMLLIMSIAFALLYYVSNRFGYIWATIIGGGFSSLFSFISRHT